MKCVFFSIWVWNVTLSKRDSNTGVFLWILRTAASACLRVTLFNLIILIVCFLKSLDAKIQSFDLLLTESGSGVRVQVLEVAIYFLYVLISHWFSRLTLLTYPLVLNLWVILNLQVPYERSCSTKEAALRKEPQSISQFAWYFLIRATFCALNMVRLSAYIFSKTNSYVVSTVFPTTR